MDVSKCAHYKEIPIRKGCYEKRKTNAISFWSVWKAVRNSFGFSRMLVPMKK